MSKSDDDLFEAFASTARERDLLHDPRWDALASGTLSEEDDRALRALGEHLEEAREAYEAFRPIDEAARDRMVARVLETLGAAKAPAPAVVLEPLAKPAVGVPLASRRSRMAKLVGAGSIALAAAAAVVFLVRTSSLAPLPAYNFSVVGGERDTRGDAAPAPSQILLGRGSRLKLTLRPATSVKGHVTAKGALVRGGVARPWFPPVQTSREGAVQIMGTKESLFPGVPPGAWEAIVAVGWPESIPDTPEGIVAAATKAHGATDGPVRFVHVNVSLRAEEVER